VWRAPAHPLRRRLRSIWPISDLSADELVCTRNTSSEPEAEGGLPPSLPAVYEALAERDVIRSTIYSGSTFGSVVAIKPVSKERHHSIARRQRWGRCPGSVRGRSPGRHVHRPSLDRWLALTEAGFGSLLVHHPSPGSGGDPLFWSWLVTGLTFSPTSNALSWVSLSAWA
jgi:hypothetical protein